MTDKSLNASFASGTSFGSTLRSGASSSPFTLPSSATGEGFLRNVLPSGINPTGRLQSIRPPRDLTLGMGTGAKPSSRRFTPTIPQRTRAVDDKSASAVKTEQSVADCSKKRGRGRGRGRGRNDNTRRRSGGRSETELKQTPSVFSAGPAQKTIRRQSVGFSGNGSSGAKTDVKGSQWPGQKIVRAESSKREINERDYSDRQMDGLVDTMDVDETVFSGPTEMIPVCLPLTKISTNPVKPKKKMDRVVEGLKQDKLSANGIVKIEKTECDSSIMTQHSASKTDHDHIAQLFEEASNERLLFMQLPDCVCAAAGCDENGKEEGQSDQQSRAGLADAPSGYAGKTSV